MMWRSFLLGIASILDSPDRIRSRSDAEALAGDWQNIGGDLRTAIERSRRDVEEGRVLSEDETSALVGW